MEQVDNFEEKKKEKNLLKKKEEEEGKKKFENVGAGCCSRPRPSPRPKKHRHVSTLQVDLHFVFLSFSRHDDIRNRVGELLSLCEYNETRIIILLGEKMFHFHFRVCRNKNAQLK